MARLTSVGVKVVQGISGWALVVGAGGAGGGVGNIVTLRKSWPFSLNVVVVVVVGKGWRTLCFPGFVNCMSR